MIKMATVMLGDKAGTLTRHRWNTVGGITEAGKTAGQAQVSGGVVKILDIAVLFSL